MNQNHEENVEQLDPVVKITLSTLSPYDRKAEAWARHDPDEELYQERCRECNGLMWTWSDKEDICETCGYELRIRREELRRARDHQHEQTKPNPFERQQEQHVKVGIEPGRQRQVNPFAAVYQKPHAVGIKTTHRSFHNPFEK